MTETDIQRLIQREVSKNPNVRLFRNQTGCYKLANGQYLHSGLLRGSGDLIGWKTIEITEDMVGKSVAVFTSVEVKTASGKLSPEQKHWMDKVNQAGGIGLVMRSANDTHELTD
ncbi:MAG: VRR-NUC domain-containing protein [Bacteroidia bacterium]